MEKYYDSSYCDENTKIGQLIHFTFTTNIAKSEVPLTQKGLCAIRTLTNQDIMCPIFPCTVISDNDHPLLPECFTKLLILSLVTICTNLRARRPLLRHSLQLCVGFFLRRVNPCAILHEPCLCIIHHGTVTVFSPLILGVIRDIH